TGGYAKGSTQLTVGSTANMAPGRLILLDQLPETSDDGGVVNSGYVPTFSYTYQTQGRHEPAEQTGCPGVDCIYRGQRQIVKIVSVSDATHVTITPGLYMPTWRSSQNPAVSGWGRTDASTGFGIGL